MYPLRTADEVTKPGRRRRGAASSTASSTMDGEVEVEATVEDLKGAESDLARLQASRAFGSAKWVAPQSP